MLSLFKETILQGGISFALSSSDRELRSRERAKRDILHACTCLELHAILSIFTMLCTNLEWVVIAPRGSFFCLVF